MMLPRVPLSYVFYASVPLLVLTRFNALVATVIASITAFFVLSFAIASLRYDTSITAFALELAISLSVCLGILGLSPRKEINARLLVRYANILCFVLSISNMAQLGFPATLPYRDFLPDAYGALFGLGGAKIVTIIGFFGVVSELHSRASTNTSSSLYFLLAALNFVIPNFIIGIVCGSAAFVFLLRDRQFLIAATLSIAIIAWSLAVRVDGLHTGFEDAFGLHPKLYQFHLVWNIYASDPTSIIFGTGPGQFSSEAALWASSAGRYVSTFSKPELPGFFSAEPHQLYLLPILERFSDDPYAISSSFNKPYGGLSTILGENGIIYAALIVFVIIRRYFFSTFSNTHTRSIGVFLLGLLLLDTSNDNPWLGLMLIATNATGFGQKPTGEAIGGA